MSSAQSRKERPASQPESLDLRVVEDDCADGSGSVERERIAGAGERSQTLVDEGGDENERERAHARIPDIIVLNQSRERKGNCREAR